MAARSSLRAAVMETRVRACREPTIKMVEIDKKSMLEIDDDDQCSPCSVRVHGSVVISLESRKIGDTRSRPEQEEETPCFREFDHRMEVADLSVFRSYVACRDLIHRMLVESSVTGKCDLAADNWEDFQPHDIAQTIVAKVRRDTEDACGVAPAYAFDVEIALKVRLIYSEPKALLLACKEAAEADGKIVPSGDLCTICMSDVQIEDNETVRLPPCSHTFHDRCILPWFHRASTCPTCRHDVMECVKPCRAPRAVCYLFGGRGDKNEKNVKLPCSHAFHSQCIGPWFHVFRRK